MRRFVNYIVFSIFITFVFIFEVYAECSFDRRKELLSKANNIEAYFEPDLENNKFVFYLYNLDDDLYVNLENLNSSELVQIYKYEFDTDYYTMDVNNTDDAIKYKIYIHSGDSECYGDYLTSKNIKKGIINKFYKNDICKGIQDYKYCVPILNNKFTIDDQEVVNRINAYKNSLLVTEEVIIEEKFGIDDLINILKKYWYIPLSFLGVIFVIFIIRFINKKRGEL